MYMIATTPAFPGFSLVSSSDVKQITFPLKTLGISFFNHVRVYPDYSFTTLTNEASWHKLLIEREIRGSFSLLDLKTGFYLWRDNTAPEVLELARNHFNPENLLNYIYASKNHMDVFAFGTPPIQASILNFYFNNLDLFNIYN